MNATRVDENIRATMNSESNERTER